MWNKYFLYLIFLVGGAAIGYFFSPEKIKIEEKEKIVTQVIEKKVNVIQTRTVKKDGTIVEKIVYVSDTKEDKKDENRSMIKVVTPKRYHVFGGISYDSKWLVGGSVKVLGPITVTGVWQDQPFVGVGFTF